MQKGCIKIVKSDGKGIDSVTKDFYFQPKKIDIFSLYMFKYIAQLCLELIVLCVVINDFWPDCHTKKLSACKNKR